MKINENMWTQINETQMMKMYEHIGKHKHEYKSKNNKNPLEPNKLYQNQ